MLNFDLDTYMDRRLVELPDDSKELIGLSDNTLKDILSKGCGEEVAEWVFELLNNLYMQVEDSVAEVRELEDLASEKEDNLEDLKADIEDIKSDLEDIVFKNKFEETVEEDLNKVIKDLGYLGR